MLYKVKMYIDCRATTCLMDRCPFPESSVFVVSRISCEWTADACSCLFLEISIECKALRARTREQGSLGLAFSLGLYVDGKKILGLLNFFSGNLLWSQEQIRARQGVVWIYVLCLVPPWSMCLNVGQIHPTSVVTSQYICDGISSGRSGLGREGSTGSRCTRTWRTYSWLGWV